MTAGGGESKRTIKLFCPSLSKLVSFVAWGDQRLDLGSISLAFGLDPNTLKLNGHFISRGLDLVASSVTWNSLLSFFSARGLSTGTSDSDALIVDGMLSKIGTKRGLITGDVKDGMPCSHKHSSDILNEELGNANLLERKRFCIRNLVAGGATKRKHWLADDNKLKKMRMNSISAGGGVSGSSLNNQSPCCFVNMKRERENGMVFSAPCKKRNIMEEECT